ncbi:MAG: hypothetical protein ACAI34_16370 [Verrucomicrobium sp.]|nr:hypothetical protein [Verrucomicrobium sp.]
MTRILTLAAVVTSLSLASCASIKKKGDCSACCAEKPAKEKKVDACCATDAAKPAKKK